MNELPQTENDAEKSATVPDPQRSGSGLSAVPCSLAECEPGQYVAVMPHFSETARIRCTVHIIEEFQGSRSWKEVTLNQGALKDEYLSRRQLRGAKFYPENRSVQE